MDAMKQIFLLSLFLILAQTSIAQTKIDEYGRINTDSESSRMDNFAYALNQEPDSKGVIIINSGESNENIGNILRQIDGIKYYLSNLRGINPERIFFSVKANGERFFKELWIYPKDLPLPELNSVKIDLTNLRTKYLYASTCPNCEPAVGSLSSDFINIESYVKLLKEYPNYSSLIIIHPSGSNVENKKEASKQALELVINYRKSLTKEYKIGGKRVFIKIAEPLRKYSPTIVDFYIVPNKGKT